MSHKKVKMACGMFDLVSPSYGRPSLIQEGPLLRTDNGILDRTGHAAYIVREVAAMKDTRVFLREVSAYRHHALAFDPRPRLRRSASARTFHNTPRLARTV